MARPLTPGKFEVRACPQCAAEFRQYFSDYSKRVYCSGVCRAAAVRGGQECRQCGGAIRVPRSHGRKYCSKTCMGLGMRLTKGRATRNEVVARYLRHAVERGLEWALNDEKVEALFAGDCHWCGAPPSNTGKRSRNYGGFIHSGIDRVDNTRGYFADNVVSCCFTCNSMKRDFPEATFLQQARAIAQRWPA